jgi:hypothetical protein
MGCDAEGIHPESRSDHAVRLHRTQTGHHSTRCWEVAGATRIPIQQIDHRKRHSGQLRPARWNDFTMLDDWNLNRVVEAIRSTAHDPEKQAVADALKKAIATEEPSRLLKKLYFACSILV